VIAFFTTRVKRPAKLALALGIGVPLLIAVAWAFLSSRHEITYQNKSLSKWFYGERTNFFYQSTREKADAAFKALGTNAFPFLLSNLEARGSSSLYFKLYRALPKAVQARLPYPISGDDIQFMTLQHFWKMQDVALPALEPLAKAVPRLRNPRVRLQGLHAAQTLAAPRYGWKASPAPLVELATKLLDDEHAGIRLDAAMVLANGDSPPPRVLQILLGALADKSIITAARAISTYTFGQPPGGSGSGAKYAGRNMADEEQSLRYGIQSTLRKFEPQLNNQQKKLLLDSKELRRYE
jgi:hypothetical protein